MKKLFVKANMQYRKAFQLATTIFEDDAKERGIYKSALVPQAQEHLKNMEQSQDKIKHYFPQMAVCKAWMKDDRLYFDFVNGTPLSKYFEDACRTQDREKFFQRMDFYLQCFTTIPENECVFEETAEFTKMFGNVQGLTGIKAYRFVPLDVTWNNIIVDKTNKPCLIDYEWCCDFPIPADYVKARGVYRMYLNLPPLKEFISIEEIWQYADFTLSVEQCKVMEQAFGQFISVEPETGLDYSIIKNKYVKNALPIADAAKMWDAAAEKEKTVQNYVESMDEEQKRQAKYIEELEASRTEMINHMQELETSRTEMMNHMQEIETSRTEIVNYLQEVEASRTEMADHIQELENAKAENK